MDLSATNRMVFVCAEEERDALRQQVSAQSHATARAQLASQGSVIASGAVQAIEGSGLPAFSATAVQSMLASPCEDICDRILQGYPGAALSAFGAEQWKGLPAFCGEVQWLGGRDPKKSAVKPSFV